MGLVLLVIYVLILMLAIAYGAIIVYHVFKYQRQLTLVQARRAIAFTTGYIIVASSLIGLSLVVAGVIAIFFNVQPI
ncbi:MAG: hypothetical protein V1807_00635 [Patescibacteria group bacterium]